MTNILRPAGLVALISLLLLALLAPADARPPRPSPPTHHVLGPGSAGEPGFTGYVTAGGAALGVARLPGGRFGICLDTGRRVWPHHRGHDSLRRDPAAGYLLSRYLPGARQDPTEAAALWWTVGLDLGLNSGRQRMRSHLDVVRRESPGVFARIRTRRHQLLADVRSHAAARYVASRPVLGAERIGGLGVLGAGGSVVPGIGVVLHLTGGTFADGRHTWRGALSKPGAPGPRWRRVTGGPVRLTVRYAGIPATGYRLVSTGPSYQRVAVAVGLGSLRRSVGLPALPLPSLHTTISSLRTLVPGIVTDSVVVRGSRGATLTGHWRLLGPAVPITGGCAGAEWSAASVFASGSFTTQGDGTSAVGATAIARPGCYTYVERLEASATTRGTGWSPAGQVTETTLGLARVALSTLASSHRATAGAVLRDSVTVTGVPAGTAPLLHWRLLGPVAPRGSACRGATWLHAPVHAQGVSTITRDGTTVIGESRVERGGCYTYEESIDATELSVATPWSEPGLPSESTAVVPASPTIPAHPLVDTGGSWRPTTRVASRTATADVQIPAVGLAAPLTPISFAGRTLRPPSVTMAGRWNAGAGLEAIVGTTIIAGHVSDDHGRLAPFARLRNVRAGATITTVSPAGHLTRWRVSDVRSYDRRALPRSLFTQRLARRLVLITCTDKVTHPDGAFHYRRNLVVTAAPAHA